VATRRASRVAASNPSLSAIKEKYLFDLIY